MKHLVWIVIAASLTACDSAKVDPHTAEITQNSPAYVGCSSINAKTLRGSWKTMDSAPRDGTVIELMQTYGIAPTYGLFKKDKDSTQHMPYWKSAIDPDAGILEQCAFWRPYAGDFKAYIDPTHGRQNTVEYWCDASGLEYNAKEDHCGEHAKTKERAFHYSSVR